MLNAFATSIPSDKLTVFWQALDRAPGRPQHLKSRKVVALMSATGSFAQDVEAAAAKFAKENPTMGAAALDAAVKPMKGARDVVVALHATQREEEAEPSVVEEAFSRCCPSLPPHTIRLVLCKKI